MTITELERKAAELKELKQMRDEVEAEITALVDAIKAHMGETEKLNAGPFVIRWAAVTSTRFDSSAFRKACPELFEKFSKTSTIRRFSVA